MCSSQTETSNCHAIFLVFGQFYLKLCFFFLNLKLTKWGFFMVLFICFPPSLHRIFSQIFLLECPHFGSMSSPPLDSVVEKALPFSQPVIASQLYLLETKTPELVYRRAPFLFIMTVTESICSMVPEEQDYWRRSLGCWKMLNVTADVCMSF